MHVTTLTPLGAVVVGVRVDTLTADDVASMRRLLAECGVLVIRGQEPDDAAFVRFLRSFGRLTFTKGETPVPGFDDLNVISNVGRTTPPRSSFHVDTTYVRKPPAYTALRAVEIPARGGHTLFSDQYRAFDTLPAALRRDLAGRTIEHVVTGVELDDGDERAATHPILRRHPITGRTALYLTTPARCAAVSGMSADDAEATVRFLYAHSTADANVGRHAWAAGDVVIWDNICVMHKADHTDVDGRRVLHRGMVAA